MCMEYWQCHRFRCSAIVFKYSCDNKELFLKHNIFLCVAGIHFFSVALHEIGHSLGLAHSYDSKAVMSPYYTESHYDLKQDDIDGIRQLYYRKWSVIMAVLY